jgi:PPK2 family polyphosphate:nucleotide phosphotransferase
MILTRVKRGTKLELGDADARPPRQAPTGDDLDEAIAKQQARLAVLQDVFYADARHALLVVLQGRDAAGKDGTIRHVFDAINPQGCQVTSFKAPTPHELAHDFLWRVHAAIPPRGIIGVFNRSHYEDVLVPRVHKLVPKAIWSRRYEQINDFERMLTENGVVVLKFFLHISRKEQKQRLAKRLTDPEENWKFRAGDLDDRKLWKQFSEAYRDLLHRCSTPWAPWYVVPADEKPVRNWLIADAIIEALEGLSLRYPPADPAVLRLEID